MTYRDHVIKWAAQPIICTKAALFCCEKCRLCLVAACRKQRLVSSREPLIIVLAAREQVAVEIKGHRNRRMPHYGLYVLRFVALLDKPARGKMSKRMKIISRPHRTQRQISDRRWVPRTVTTNSGDAPSGKFPCYPAQARDT